MGRRRQFGSIRKRHSGRWQAQYWHEGRLHTGPTTFLTKGDAAAFLAMVETSILRGTWIDPSWGRVTFGAYAEFWLESRSDLRPRSVEQYRGLLKRYLIPEFGRTEMGKVRPAQVRSWFAGVAKERPTSAAGAYRLLRAIFNTALRDELVSSSPCRLTGAAVEHAAERPMLTTLQVEELADGMPERFRVAVTLAAWGGLRRGEVLGLRRGDINEVTGRIHVERTLHEMHDGRVLLGPPKSAAGTRYVHLPRPAMIAVITHMHEFVEPEAEAHLLVSQTGGPLRPRTLETAWRRSRIRANLPATRFHDLRHFHLTLFATTGATTAELMSRAGHSSPRAALVYQHATQDRDRVLADALAGLVAPVKLVVPEEKNAIRSRPDRARDAGRPTGHAG
jgi:integrase